MSVHNLRETRSDFVIPDGIFLKGIMASDFVPFYLREVDTSGKAFLRLTIGLLP